jgi:hypothetical protein
MITNEIFTDYIGWRQNDFNVQGERDPTAAREHARGADALDGRGPAWGDNSRSARGRGGGGGPRGGEGRFR